MAPFLMAQGIFATGCLLFATGFYASQAFNHYSGSLTAKLAAETSTKCEAEKANATEYAACLKGLQTQIAILAETGELKLDDCDVAGSKVYCWVRVWLVPHRLEITRAALAELRARQRHSEEATTTTPTTPSTPTTTAKPPTTFKLNNNLF